ncbi:NineTeen Complex (NTC) component [Scheffersomyces spartinae]|uniref:Pre-mRNA-splicing factor CLF1 n=1 Tax=Scheffersomyces spartinae TaxID=45513 RepID=A0A9P8AJK7_9ASCO|nr:NineTeen Complex (NTC) component [Scheffersomyces spartinae]KAG7194984.1 NineTeen Complex (NTC) component [Scheffersomyces spartinae]
MSEVSDTPKVSELQITSEQILDDAYSQRAGKLNRPQQTIQDLDELRSYQQTKRREYEQQLNKNRLNFGQWMRYAKWEAEFNHDFARARSIFERALQVNVEHVPFWVHYIRFELSHRNVNHARNILDRAVTILPRVDKIWFMYVQAEESLKNYIGVRNVFERWMSWKPNPTAWDAYIAFETRYEEFDNAEAIFQRYVTIYPVCSTWISWIELELSRVPIDPVKIRGVFESAVDTIVSESKRIKKGVEDAQFTDLIERWALWELQINEVERANSIFQLFVGEKSLLVVKLSQKVKDSLQRQYIEFCKINGVTDNIEGGITLKRKLKYQQEIEADKEDYDGWWGLLNIMEKENRNDELRQTFDLAIANIPSDSTKSLRWRRYMMIYVRYALWEELTQNQPELAKTIMEKAISVVPHSKFTFGKCWINLADYFIRHSDKANVLGDVRKLLGRALGTTCKAGPKRNLFRYYINFEQRLGELDRVRKLYEKWLETSLASDLTYFSSVEVLLEYINFEKSLQEHERCEALFELGLQILQDKTLERRLSPEEAVWMSFISYYKDDTMEYEKARQLYRRLLDSNGGKPQTWISFAHFESAILDDKQLEQFLQLETETEFEFVVTQEHIEASRNVFMEANTKLRDHGSNQDRYVLLEAWKSYELEYGDSESLAKVEKMLPTIVKKRKLVGEVTEEYIDYVFPEKTEAKPNLSMFLANAKKWALSQK